MDTDEPPPPVRIDYFRQSPAGEIPLGGTYRLEWGTTGATRVLLDGVEVQPSGWSAAIKLEWSFWSHRLIAYGADMRSATQKIWINLPWRKPATDVV
jgi:hypothetical protein